MGIKKIMIKLFHFELMQRRWGRKWIGGNFYYVHPNLPMAPFWSDTLITSCQAKFIAEEKY
jgi:hypothetical protein